MDISWWRDMMIIIWGFITTIAVTFLCVIVYRFYRKTILILRSADSLVAKANEVVDYTEDKVLKPAMQFGEVVQGLAQGIGLFANMFKKKEE